MTFGQNLKRIRKDMKLTQQEMADKIGISRSYLSDIEQCKKIRVSKQLQDLLSV